MEDSFRVLRKEGAIEPSPPTINILSVSNPPRCEPTSGHVHADAHRCTSRVYGPHVSPSKRNGKHAAKATPAMSWAEVARKGAKERERKEMGSPKYFYEI
jgi:hypothetical protein